MPESTARSDRALRQPRFRLVFVVGVGRSGSTLLGRTLNMHPRVLCVGEMARADRAMKAGGSCCCGEPLGECSFWRPFLPQLEAAGHYDFRRFTPGLYDSIRQATGRDVVVDLSKSRVYRMTRRWRDGGEAYLFLVRDPRGVIASGLRSGNDLESALRKHKKWMSRLQRFVAKKGDRALLVYYENFAGRPEPELRRICEFLGLEFAPAMLRPADKAHHFISSNRGEYLRNSSEIRLDERWRAELTPEQIDRIERMMRGMSLWRDRFLNENRPGT